MRQNTSPNNIFNSQIDSFSNDAECVLSGVLCQRASILMEEE